MIHNLHLLISDDPLPEDKAIKVTLEDAMLNEHRLGVHDQGHTNSECPLCQLDK